MHCVVAVFYGFVVLTGLVLYAAITNGNWVLVLALSPVIVSGVAVVVLIIDTLIWLIREGWKAIG